MSTQSFADCGPAAQALFEPLCAELVTRRPSLAEGSQVQPGTVVLACNEQRRSWERARVTRAVTSGADGARFEVAVGIRGFRKELGRESLLRPDHAGLAVQFREVAFLYLAKV